jgi:hypothetical protein
MDHILHAAVVVAQVHSKKLLLLSCRHQEKTTRSDTTLCRVLYIPWTAAVADARVKIGKQNSIYIYIYLMRPSFILLLLAYYITKE